MIAPTSKVLLGMFLEQVPMSLCDSGGAYGYQFQRRRKNPPDKKPDSTLKADPDYRSHSLEVEARVNMYKWLCDKAEYNPRLTAKMRAWMHKNDGGASDWVESIRNVAHRFHDNTYNHDNIFDGDFDFCSWETWEGREHVVIRIHGGCDIRGGYSSPRVFDIDGDFCSFPDHTVMPVGRKHDDDPWWAMQGGMDFTPGSHGPGFTDMFGREEHVIPKKLDEYEWVGPPDVQRKDDMERYAGQGILVVDHQERLLCPHTGRPLELVP